MVAILAFLLAVASVFASARVFDVQVGAGGELRYSPDRIAARPGDTVVFHFHPRNHTVTQSSSGAPCTYNGGFDSGFMPVADGASNFPTYSFTVRDTNPVWAYCRQNNHCRSGMVFAINAAGPRLRSFSAFKNLAVTLNGTGTANASTPSSTSAASQIKFRFATLLMPLAFLAFAL